MLGVASICWAMWKTQNRSCFEKKHIKNEIIYTSCVFIRYWGGLYPEDTQRVITAGIDGVERLKLLRKQGGAAPTLLIKDKAGEDDESPRGVGGRGFLGLSSGPYDSWSVALCFDG
jgi:hypothetical protein